MTTEEPAPDNLELPETTLGMYGMNLPIGVIEGKPPRLVKGFAFKPYRMTEEKAIGKIRKKKGGPGKHQGKIVQYILAHMLTEWGGDASFASKSEKHRLNEIQNAHMVDVLYAYIMLRCEALGYIVAMDAGCGECGHEWKWEADIQSLDFRIVNDLEQLAGMTFRLGTPIEVGPVKYDTLVLTPPKWLAVCGVAGNAGMGEIKARLILSSVHAATSSTSPDENPIALGTYLLDQMTKLDIEGIQGDMEEAFPNIDLTMDIDCPKCEHSFSHAVNWQFDFFFGTSSLPNRKPR